MSKLTFTKEEVISLRPGKRVEISTTGRIVFIKHIPPLNESNFLDTPIICTWKESNIDKEEAFPLKILRDLPNTY